MSDPKCPDCGKSLLECQGWCKTRMQKVREEIAKVLMQEETPDIMPPYRSYPGLPKEIADIKLRKILAIEIGGEVKEECTDKESIEDFMKHCPQDQPSCEMKIIPGKGKRQCSGYVTRPRTFGDIVAAESDPVKVKQLLGAEINKVLENLSK